MSNICIIEIKSPKIGKTVTASAAIYKVNFLDCNQDRVTLKKKHKFYCQVQLGMFVTGLQFCHFILHSSFDDICFIIEVSYDADIVINYFLLVLEYVHFQHIIKYLVSKSEKI